MATVRSDEKVGALRKVRLFRELDDPELRTIADQANLRKTEANETLAKDVRHLPLAAPDASEPARMG